MRASQQQSTAPPLVSIDWRGVLGGILFFVLLTVVGPCTLVLGWLLRTWCRRSIFDAHDRWDSVRAFAWCFCLLLALALALALIAFRVFPGQAFSLWAHTPLHLLGTPDLLGNLFLRWLVSIPLAFALALSMGWGETRLMRRFVRVPTEREQQLTEKRRREQEEQARRIQQAERERAARMTQATKPTTPAQAKPSRATLTASASPPATTTLRPASSPIQPPGAISPPAASQGKPTLWDELAADHPWKQLAQQEQNQPPPQPGQATPPAEPPPPSKKEKPKPPDLGDGSMDALL